MTKMVRTLTLSRGGARSLIDIPVLGIVINVETGQFSYIITMLTEQGVSSLVAYMRDTGTDVGAPEWMSVELDMCEVVR